MSDNNVLDQLSRNAARNQPPLGIFIASTDPSTTEIAGSTGFDFIIIDAEHSPMDRQNILAHVRAAEAKGLVPIVRALETSDSTIQSMLDMGCAGVVCPKLETADDARRLVAATRYAPEGKRGMCPACHDGAFNLKAFSDHMRRRNRTAMVIPIIETIRGLNNIEEIVAVDGIDLIHFGPGDLSAGMGLDLSKDMPVILEAWERVRAASMARGKKTLVPHGFGFERADSYVAMMDLMLLFGTLETVVADFKASAAG